MRVLLVNPPLSPSAEISPPLGLSVLASWLLHLGHDVRIVDLDLETKAQDQSYLNIFQRQAAEFVPQVVGVTSMYNNSLQAEHLMQAAKECCDVPIVAGGSHFGAMAKRALLRIPQL